MKYPYGQDFTLNFYPWLNDEPISGIPIQSVDLYIFNTLPTLAVAQAGTGAISHSIATYSSGNYFTFAVDAIDDPNGGADSVDVTDIYYAAVNFYLETGGQKQSIVFPIALGQIVPKLDAVTVNVSYLTNLYPQLLTYLTEAEVEAQISNAYLAVVNLLKAKGYDFDKIRTLKQLDSLIALKALSDSLRTQIIQAGDKFEQLSQQYKDDYQTVLSGLVIEYGDIMSPLTSGAKRLGGSIEVLR